MTEYLISAIRNLSRKKMRSFLTMAGITIGVASVIVIGSVGEGGKLAVSKQLDSLGVNGLNIRVQTDYSKIGNNVKTIQQNDVQTCSGMAGVSSAMPVIMQYGASVTRGVSKNILVWGVGADAGNIISLKVLHGKMFTAQNIKNHDKVCLVDETYAKSVYKRVNITGKTITVYLGNGYQNIYVPYTTAEDLRGAVGYDQIALKMKSNNDIDEIGQKIIALLNKEHGTSGTFIADNMLRQKQQMSDMLNIVTLIISAIGAISLIVAGLSIMTVMIVSVNERTREIGIKKAIGATKRDIMVEFLFEALLISLLGSLFGIAAGIGLSGIASAILKFAFQINLQVICYAAGFAVMIGVLFGVYPAFLASRLKPVDALRQE